MLLQYLGIRYFLFRAHEDENKATATPSANEYVGPATNSNMENLTVTLVQQSEVSRTDFVDVTNSAEYNLSSTPNYTASSAAHPDSASHNYLQETQQMQNISPLTGYMVCALLFLWLQLVPIWCKCSHSNCFYKLKVHSYFMCIHLYTILLQSNVISVNPCCMIYCSGYKTL
jgi:hypothetical protein